MKIKYKDLYQFRSVWMGLAALLVVYYHSNINIGFLRWVKRFGYSGVDIFVFASGIGCYYSLSKNTIAIFVINRVKRIVPSYWYLLFCWSLYKYFTCGSNFQTFLGNCTGLQYLTGWGGDFNWYIGLLLLMYLAAPVLYALIKDGNNFINIKILAYIMAATVVFWKQSVWVIIITRMLLFYEGLLFGKLGIQNKTMTEKSFIASNIFMLAGLIFTLLIFDLKDDILWSYGLFWYPFSIIIPGLCINISLLAMKFQRSRFLNYAINFFKSLGNISFEIFLTHIFLFDIFRYLISNNYVTESSFRWIILFLMVLPISFSYGKLVKWICSVNKKFMR